MGYGPAVDSTDAGRVVVTGYDDNLHPPVPVITSSKMVGDASEILKFDANFIMTKPGESVAIRHVRKSSAN